MEIIVYNVVTINGQIISINGGDNRDEIAKVFKEAIDALYTEPIKEEELKS